MTDPRELDQLVRACSALKRGDPVPLDTAQVVAEALASSIARGRPPTRLEYFFKPYGAGWLIGPKDAPVYLRTRKQGFWLIRFLISNPGKQIHCLQVAHRGHLHPDQVVGILTEENAERSRKNTTKQIKAALGDIEAECPIIADHLHLHLSTGIYSCYVTDHLTQPIWNLGGDRVADG